MTPGILYGGIAVATCVVLCAAIALYLFLKRPRAASGGRTSSMTSNTKLKSDGVEMTSAANSQVEDMYELNPAAAAAAAEAAEKEKKDATVREFSSDVAKNVLAMRKESEATV